MRRGGWVYIMTNRYRGTLYVGMSSPIAARSFQHATQAGSDFCRRHGLTRLVYARQKKLDPRLRGGDRGD